MDDGRYEKLVLNAMGETAKALLVVTDPARIHRLQGKHEGFETALKLLHDARKSEIMDDQDPDDRKAA